MEIPKPPEDQELHNIIDKLAQFVARNGPEFEQMTKDKQRDNPRFYFLFGGEFYNYYRFRVQSEQNNMINNNDLQQQQPQLQQQGNQFVNQQMINSGPQQSQSNMWQNNGINNINNNMNPNVLSQQINESKEQIRQSEANLSAQHQVLMQTQKMMIDDVIKQSQDEHLRRMTQDFNVDLNDFESVLQPIVDNCTKESIANGKMWIFNHCNAPIHYEIVSKYLLKRITQIGSTFDTKLHLMYLINDLFNHCMRKGDDSLKRSLEKVIVPIFCFPFTEADEDKQQKLTKLLKLWEVNQYFDRTILDQLQNAPLALANYKSSLCNEFSGQINSITNGQSAKYNQLQKQHSDFVNHQQSKIQQLQQQLASVTQMPVTPLSMPANISHPSVPRLMMPNQQQNLGPRPPLQFDAPPPPPTSVPMFLPLVHQTPPPQTSNANQPSQPLLLPPIHQSPQMSVRLGPVPQLPQSLVPGSQPFSNPMTSGPFPVQLPPNHQFFNAVHNTAPIPPKEVIPDVPYHELPAGLMAPLVKLEDFEYKPIIPKDIRLPPPAPPSDRLLQAVEMFYAPPTHERPRNSDGWEQLGLYEFFKAKSHAKKVREDKSPFFENEIENFDAFHVNPVDNDNNESIISLNNVMPAVNQITTDNNSIHNQKSDQSVSSSQSRHRSPSPSKRRYREYREEKSPRKNKTKRSRSRSPSSSRRRRSRSMSDSRSRSRSPLRHNRSHSRSRSRSISPPHSFSSYGKPENSRIDETNKGHQMLKKMGWSGVTGLGAAEQGIQDPIRGGEVRERDEKYRGVGISKNSESDPYESFRRNKGQAFMQRISQGREGKSDK